MIPLLRILNVQLALRRGFRTWPCSLLQLLGKSILDTSRERVVCEDSSGIGRGRGRSRVKVQNSLWRWLSEIAGAVLRGRTRRRLESCRRPSGHRGGRRRDARSNNAYADSKEYQPEYAHYYAKTDLDNEEAPYEFKNPLEHVTERAVDMGDLPAVRVGTERTQGRLRRWYRGWLFGVNGTGILVGAVLSHGTGPKSRNKTEGQGGFYV